MESLSTISKLKQAELQDAAAAGSKHGVRQLEFEAALNQKAAASHSHTADAITDFTTSVQSKAAAYFVDGDTIVWSGVGGTNRKAEVKLKPAGGLAASEAGLEVDFGSGTNQAARGDHTHAQLHNPLTVATPVTIAFSLTPSQQLGAEVKFPANKGLKSSQQGLELEYGTDANHPAAGNHTHGQLHDALTAIDTDSVDLVLSGSQTLRALVKRDLTSGGQIAVTPNGIYVVLGTGANQAAAGNHVHENATAASAGFMSVEDKQKLDLYTSVLQTDQCVPFFRPDVCSAGQYVGGRRRWGQAMQIMEIQLASLAPGTQGLLGLEVDGVIVEHIAIPSGVPQLDEVLNQKTLSNVHVAADKWVRVKLVSGTGALETEAARLDVCLRVRPSIALIASVKINAGGAEEDPFIADAFYGSGGAVQASGNAIDLSAVSSPAPQAVYKCARYKYNDPNPLSYVITGLARGVNYQVRIHLAELQWTAVGKQKMNITVIGKTTSTINNVDTYSLAGARFKAVVQEFASVEPSNDGILEVRFTPVASVDSTFNLSVNGIELNPIVS